MGIIHLLRDAIETEVDNVDLEGENIVTPVESAILEYADIVLPWLWRASHYGLQSDLAQSMVFSSLEIDSDLDIVVVAISLPSRS